MALILLPLSLDAYERIKSVKVLSGLSSLSDSDFFSQIFETELPKITTTPETVLEIKSEMEDSYFDHFSAPINQSLQCTSCKYKTSNDQELLSHFQSHHKYPGNYHCCCGLNFDDLTAFIQHSVLCATNKSNTTNVTKPDLKRKIISEPDLNYEPRNMRQRIAKLECRNCPRKFHTEYTLYLHDCQNNGVNKTSQNKLGNGNTSCLIKNQAHNHQQIQDQPNNNVNIILDYEMQRHQIQERNITQYNELQNVQVSNHDEVEDKNIISVQQRSPLSIKKSSSVFIRKRNPVIIKESSPILIKEYNPVLIKQYNPMLIKRHSPVLIKEGMSALIKECSPVLIKECSPLLIKERNPSLIKECSPIKLKEGSVVKLLNYSTEQFTKHCTSPIQIPVNKKQYSPVGIQEHYPNSVLDLSSSQAKECSPLKAQDNKILPAVNKFIQDEQLLIDKHSDIKVIKPKEIEVEKHDVIKLFKNEQDDDANTQECTPKNVEHNKIFLSTKKLIQPEPLLIDKHSDIKVRESNEIGVERHDTIKLFKNKQDDNIQECSNDTLKIELGRLTCYCSEVFTDLIPYILHQKTCGKPIVSTTPYISNNEKQIPLKVPVNSKGTYDCKECSKTFKSILSLRQHWDGMHRETPKFICKKCGRGIRWCTSFHYHSRKCKAVKPSNV